MERGFPGALPLNRWNLPKPFEQEPFRSQIGLATPRVSRDLTDRSDSWREQSIMKRGRPLTAPTELFEGQTLDNTRDRKYMKFNRLSLQEAQLLRPIR